MIFWKQLSGLAVGLLAVLTCSCVCCVLSEGEAETVGGCTEGGVSCVVQSRRTKNNTERYLFANQLILHMKVQFSHEENYTGCENSN